MAPPSLRNAPAVQTSRLANIFAELALGSPVASLRQAACNVIQGLWRYLLLHGKRKQGAAIMLVQTLLAWLPHLAAYGAAAAEASRLMAAILEGPSSPQEHLKPKPSAPEALEEQGSKKAKSGALSRSRR